jgi:drug/metabolite transporter, DME family
MSEKTAGRLLILTAAVLWSTNGFFAKAPLFADWPAEIDGMPVRGPLLAFWRALFATLVLLPFVRRPRWRIQLVPMVLAYVAMNYTFLNALTLTNEANAIWLQNTAPMWVFLIGVLVFREPVHPRDGWLLGCSVLGIGLILWFEIRGQAPEPAWLTAGRRHHLCRRGALAALSAERRRSVAGHAEQSGHRVGLLAVRAVSRHLARCRQIVYLAAFGVFQMGLPYLLFARGLRYIVGHEAAGIVLLEPILVPVWVYLAWRHAPTYEFPQWWTLVGGALILIGLTGPLRNPTSFR